VSLGITIGLHFEDAPMCCRECGKQMYSESIVLQIGSADMGNITPIEGLCESCAKKSSLPQNQGDQPSTDNI
jgi:hypothetical protein